MLYCAFQVFTFSLLLSHVGYNAPLCPPTPFCDSFSLKSLFLPRGVVQEVKPCLGQCACVRLICTFKQVMGRSRWCPVSQRGICESSTTYSPRKTCLWDDKALLLIKYSSERHVFSELPTAQMFHYVFLHAPV